MYKVNKSVFTALLANMSELFTSITGLTLNPSEIDHHGTSLEIEVDRINLWLLAANQALAEQKPSPPKIIGSLKELITKKKEGTTNTVDSSPVVVNVDGNYVSKGSDQDDRWGPGGTEVTKKKRKRN